jgi:hypothetical protein
MRLMRVRLSDRSQLADLVEYLARSRCRLAFRAGELEVRPRPLPVDPALRYEELELSALLRVWSVFRPDAGVELVRDEPHRTLWA